MRERFILTRLRDGGRVEKEEKNMTQDRAAYIERDRYGGWSLYIGYDDYGGGAPGGRYLATYDTREEAAAAAQRLGYIVASYSRWLALGRASA
jgi:hypothetical protein